MRTLSLIFGFSLLAVAASAISLEEAQQEAEAWTLARKDAILDRVTQCISEDPRKCHTAFAATTTSNTLPTDSALATITLDDPGRLVTTRCGQCYIDEGTFAQAGISIPATAPVNAKIDVAHSSRGWSAQLQVRIRYDGQLRERGFATGPDFSGFAWRDVEE